MTGDGTGIDTHGSGPHGDLGQADGGTAVRLSGVTVVRSGNNLLRDVDWQVREGEHWVVLGSNGAGKTTLLSVVCALIFPTRGVADVLGERLGRTDVSELRTRIGLMSSALAHRVPAAEKARDVVLTASFARVGRWRERYDDSDLRRADGLLARLGVARLADRPFGTLSEGERKRVQLARALMADPELLLLDEPAAGLDLGAREALLSQLTRLTTAPGSPVTVMVTHHVEEIPVGVTHVLLLKDGVVVAAGPIKDVLTAPMLSRCFGFPLVLERREGRYTSRAALD